MEMGFEYMFADKTDEALPDEIEAIREADISIAKFGTVDFSEINWD